MYRQATAVTLMGHNRITPDGSNDSSSTNKAEMKAAVYKLLERPRSSRYALAFFATMVVSIVASTVTWALTTVDELADNESIRVIEIICGVVFTFEMSLRLFAMQSLRTLVQDSTFWIDVPRCCRF